MQSRQAPTGSTTDLGYIENSGMYKILSLVLVAIYQPISACEEIKTLGLAE
jgi:hypothetical protein